MTTQADFDLNNLETDRAEALNRCDFNWDGTLANLPSDLSSGYYEIAARELDIDYRALRTNQSGYEITDEQAEEFAELAWNLAAEDAKQEIQEKYGN